MRYGLSELYSPEEDALVDIVFVHGLNGDFHQTWTAKKSRMFWPAQLLPSIVGQEKVRILSYGYDSNLGLFIENQSSNSLAYHAEQFVTQLVANRRLRKANERPLVFVAHSLGGLLVKRALIYSADIYDMRSENLRSVFISTYGILFLGTPNVDSSIVQWRSCLERIFNAVYRGKMIMPQIDEKTSEIVQDTNNRFLSLIDRFRIYSFHEGMPTNVKGNLLYAVDEQSVSPMVQDVEHASINADHQHMCKFEDDSAPGFDLVAEAIKRYAGDAPSTIAERWKVEKEEMLMKKEQA